MQAVRRALAAARDRRSLRRARRLRRAQRTEAAARHLEAALDADGSGARLHAELADCYAALEHWGAVRRTARRGLAEHPRHARLLLLLGRAEQQRQALASAAVNYATALALDPSLSDPRARALVERLDGSRSEFEPVVHGDSDGTEIVQRLRKRNGDADRRLERVVAEHAAVTSAYRQALWAATSTARRRYLTGGDQDELARIESLLHASDVGDPSELMLRTAARQGLEIPSSYLASIVLRSRRRQLLKQHGQDLPDWILNTKRRAYEFGDLLGVPRPWRSPEPLPLADIDLVPGSVMKPAGGGGARGVFLHQSSGDVLEIGTGEVLTDADHAHRRARQLLRTGDVPGDAWYLEEVVEDEDGSPARDLKFFAFYGRVALVLEIDRFPEPTYCWWYRDGSRADITLYRDKPFPGLGPSRTDVDLAEEVSAEIPAPFVRIDFLAGADGLRLGEFTARPGAIEQLDRDTDRWLGQEFLEAESRLEADLVAGRTFAAFSKLQDLRFHNPHVPGSGHGVPDDPRLDPTR